MIQTFAELTGDFNKIHLDEEYAKTTRFKTCISHGFLVASLFSPLFAKEIPNCIYVSQSLRFIAPVYPNSNIIVHASLVKKDNKKLLFTTECLVEDKQVIIGEAEIYDQENKTGDIIV
jgi:3-hydroxybutyryl-CoA dehydratase